MDLLSLIKQNYKQNWWGYVIVWLCILVSFTWPLLARYLHSGEMALGYYIIVAVLPPIIIALVLILSLKIKSNEYRLLYAIFSAILYCAIMISISTIWSPIYHIPVYIVCWTFALSIIVPLCRHLWFRIKRIKNSFIKKFIIFTLICVLFLIIIFILSCILD